MVIRQIIFKILGKYNTISSPEQVGEALKKHKLPERVKDEIVTKYGGNPPATWFDALERLQDHCRNEISDKSKYSAGKNTNNDLNRETLWELVLDHPITSYVPVQCQSCGGHIVPNDMGSDDADLGLTEEPPSPEETPFVRTGWFRSPRVTPTVFVLNCPKCGAVSRWFRSRDPQIILNPKRWGRLCGE